MDDAQRAAISRRIDELILARDQALQRWAGVSRDAAADTAMRDQIDAIDGDIGALRILLAKAT